MGAGGPCLRYRTVTARSLRVALGDPDFSDRVCLGLSGTDTAGSAVVCHLNPREVSGRFQARPASSEPALCPCGPCMLRMVFP